jgi:hypothetical protein
MRFSRRFRDALIVATGIAYLSAAGLLALGYLVYRRPAASRSGDVRWIGGDPREGAVAAD